MPDRPDVAIFGAGAWGTALSTAWGREGARVGIEEYLETKAFHMAGR